MEMKVCWIRFFVRKLLTFWSFYELAARKLASRMLYKLSESALLKSEVCCYDFISDLSVHLLRPAAGKGGKLFPLLRKKYFNKLLRSNI